MVGGAYGACGREERAQDMVGKPEGRDHVDDLCGKREDIVRNVSETK